MKSQNSIIPFLIVISFLILGCDRGESVRILKLAHILDTKHPIHKGLEYLAEKVYQNSNGQVRIEIYPGGQLGSEREYIESLQIGSLDMTKVSSSVVENFVPDMAVFSLPYLFRDDEHRWQVLQGSIGRDILLQGKPFWLRGLCFYETGSRSFYLRDKEVNTPDDLEGLKIRVMRSYWSIRTINALGASATPIAFGELYTALQQGVVDGAENNVPTLYQSHHYEACNYYTFDEHSAPSDVLLISTHSWNRLTDQQQKWLDNAVDASVRFQRELWDDEVKKDIEEMRGKGIKFIYPDKEPFRRKVQQLYQELKESKNPLYNLVLQIRSVDAKPDIKDYHSGD